MMEKRKSEAEIYAALPKKLLPWYRANRRDVPWRRDREPYHVLVSEIMLQQTRVETVRGYYLRFLERLPTVRDLADCPEDELLKLWEGLGYYSRVRNLQKAARAVVDDHGGVFPDTYDELLKLPGVGPYTAGAIASICFERACAAVDGNVLRVTARVTGSDAPIDQAQTKKAVAARLEEIYPKGACGDFTQALMELGAMVCTPRSPDCANCPMGELCVARAENLTATLPVKSPKKEKRVEQRTVFLLRCGERIALCRRADGGLLSGLWQLPNVGGELDTKGALEQVQNFGITPDALHRRMDRVHIFTHIRWEMTCYEISCRDTGGEFEWVPLEKVREQYALPTAFRMFLEGLEEGGFERLR